MRGPSVLTVVRDRRVLTAVKVLVSLTLVIVVLRRVPLAEVGRVLLGCAPMPVLLGILLFVLAQFLGALRFTRLMAAKGERVALGRVARAYFVGLFLNNFAPAGLGSDLTKSVSLSRGHSTTAVLSTVLVEKYASTVALFTLASLALLGPAELPPALLALRPWIWAVALMLLAVAPVFSPVGALLARQLAARFETTEERLRAAFASRPSTLAFSVGLSLAFQGTLLLSAWILARAVGMELSPGSFVAFLSVCTVALMLPLSVNGLGLREWLFLGYFTSVGQSRGQAMAFAILILTRLLVGSLIGALLLLWPAPGEERGETQRG